MVFRRGLHFPSNSFIPKIQLHTGVFWLIAAQTHVQTIGYSISTSLSPGPWSCNPVKPLSLEHRSQELSPNLQNVLVLQLSVLFRSMRYFIVRSLHTKYRYGNWLKKGKPSMYNMIGPCANFPEGLNFVHFRSHRWRRRGWALAATPWHKTL